MGAERQRGPMDKASMGGDRRPLEAVKAKFVRAKGWYVPSLHDKYLCAGDKV